VADDDASVRALLAVALMRHGFDTQLVPDGREALAMFRRCSGEFDLVVLDVRLPDMDGPETLAALRAIDPRVRCCFITGDAGGYSASELAGLGPVQVFEKPLCLADFTAALLESVGRE
jgi:DNA-binding NtrC family response regulator